MVTDTIFTKQNKNLFLNDKENISFKRPEKKYSSLNLDYNDEFIDLKLIDLDNDSDNDIFLFTNCNCRNSKLYKNEITYYDDITFESGIISKSLGKSAVISDINNDGFLDIISTHNNKLIIFKNTNSKLNNSIAFNSKIPVKRIDLYIGDRRKTIYSHKSDNYLFQSSNYLHFGLGDDIVDSVIVIDNNGKYKLENFKVNETNILDDSELNNYLNYSGEIRTFPNPFKSSIKFENNSNLLGNSQILIYNMEGRIVFSKYLDENFNNSDFEWNGLSNDGVKVPNGIYNFRITTTNNTFKGKIIKIG